MINKDVLGKCFSVFVLLSLAGCVTTSQVAIKHQFPQVLSEPREYRAAIVVDESFRSYIGRPNSKTEVDIGVAQAEIMEKVFSGLFNELEVVDSIDDVSFQQGLVITPSVVEVQMSVPSDTYLNVYEIWIKYKLSLQTTEGEDLDNWFFPAYGKTTDSFMLSRTEAIQDATIVALRDAGAKLMLDFYRVPAVVSWLNRQNQLAEQSE